MLQKQTTSGAHNSYGKTKQLNRVFSFSDLLTPPTLRRSSRNQKLPWSEGTSKKVNISQSKQQLNTKCLLDKGFFLSQTATAVGGVGSLQQPPDTGLIEKSERLQQGCIYWSAGGAMGGATDVAGRVPSSANAIGWRWQCAVLRHQPVLLVFPLSSVFFPLVRGLCRCWKPWRMGYKQAGDAVWRVKHGARGLCACTYHSAPPCLRYNVAIPLFFFSVPMKVQITQEVTVWPHWSLAVVCLGQRCSFFPWWSWKQPLEL